MSLESLTLVKARFSKDARISRARFAKSLEIACGEALAENLMPPERGLADAVRWGINHAMRPFQKFTGHDGTECRAIVASAKGKELDISVHVQRRGEDVDYSRCVARVRIVSTNGKKEFQIDYGDDSDRYRQICEALIDQQLENYGKRYLFETDLRRIAEALLDGKALKLWPGIYAALDATATAELVRVQALMSLLDEGSIRFSVLKLENSVDNRKALADELAEEFNRAYGEIETRAGKPGPNTELLEKELATLQERRYTAERILGVEIPCNDSQSTAEFALLAIQD